MAPAHLHKWSEGHKTKYKYKVYVFFLFVMERCIISCRHDMKL